MEENLVQGGNPRAGVEKCHKLQKLLPEHVQGMANALRQKEPTEGKRKLGPRSVEYACLVLSRALNQAKR
ncbi:hypothetical protein K2Z83_02715 [Oscillochloris sp. ZM17-4]|uniref:hypothetical protein n=1 Tax=Oscillochloris sp. ZM17-4 TaxID=2866714 RepID=UPI001C73B266|nr:hypothetical protein [Oscillochloris sp. ZM17-4]MBX0326603.1 hypothetical protein [Oscillochloris sp. ZM17-4]